MKLLLFLFFFILNTAYGFSITWDEPWQDEVLKNSEYFILGKVIESTTGTVKIKVLKNFGDKKTESEITLEGFYMLRICTKNDSSKTDVPTFFFHMIDSVYLFLKKTDIGYCIPTPTSGYAIVTGGKVLSTFRHSYQQAHLPVLVYEKCMGAIWNSYRNLPYDTKFVNEFLEKNLKQKPSGFKDHEIKLFFNQHAALEMIYHMRLKDKFALVKPFVNCGNNHLMISAVRCLRNFSTTETKKMLLDYVRDDAKDNFTRVMAVWSLTELKPVEFKKELKVYSLSANQEGTGFGGNGTDPRSCTYVPNLKQALTELVSGL
jgi:hypothetical protein